MVKPVPKSIMEDLRGEYNRYVREFYRFYMFIPSHISEENRSLKSIVESLEKEVSAYKWAPSAPGIMVLDMQDCLLRELYNHAARIAKKYRGYTPKYDLTLLSLKKPDLDKTTNYINIMRIYKGTMSFPLLDKSKSEEPKWQNQNG